MRPETKIERQISSILVKYPNLSPFGDEAKAMLEIANYVMEEVLKLEQITCHAEGEWAIETDRIEQLQKELFTTNIN